MSKLDLKSIKKRWNSIDKCTTAADTEALIAEVELMHKAFEDSAHSEAMAILEVDRLREVLEGVMDMAETGVELAFDYECKHDIYPEDCYCERERIALAAIKRAKEVLEK